VLPPGQSSDSCRGPEEIKRFWEGLDETFEELRQEMYHQVTTFEAGRMVRITYFTDWSQALDALRTE
jgi:hypothetical protein